MVEKKTLLDLHVVVFQIDFISLNRTLITFLNESLGFSPFSKPLISLTLTVLFHSAILNLFKILFVFLSFLFSRHSGTLLGTSTQVVWTLLLPLSYRKAWQHLIVNKNVYFCYLIFKKYMLVVAIRIRISFFLCFIQFPFLLPHFNWP